MDRLLYIPGYVRVHLIMHGSHVGYMILREESFKEFLWEPREYLMDRQNQNEKTISSTAKNQIVPDSK